ncbi:MBL fold metallo-hydrolase [Paenibacillus sp. GD4]|jgi:L-ascorbate metabolism protein UlaG (beta-lactamase superfamily)|uniref:MBL fold metallo-hydrolase n=1 Tax=Paenibacillus sp. GD4 TaxID=3068890 RepID=UPI0027966A2C|nr:MBL fold metallo-hydrolase [Paenibacillus sp. GD4]MDQ1911020.1 MBL fold metallo-hydrolase [Paenibacillus sp. GD4]
MKLQLIRHATLSVVMSDKTMLVDPMLSEQGINPPIPNSTDERRNPLVALPKFDEKLLQPDAVLITHLHPDHWDEAAAQSIAKSTTVICPEECEASLAAQGFAPIHVISSELQWKGIRIFRTGGKHGFGEVGARMGKVSGFVLQAPGEPVIYIAGDTVYCEEVERALDQYRPDLTVLNAGGAQFRIGGPITMNAEDVEKVCRYAPYTQVAAVHMDTLNHCLVTRKDLKHHLRQAGLESRVWIPEDGEEREYVQPSR